MRTLSSHDSTRQNVPGLEVSANPDIPGLTCSRSITLVAAYSTLLTAGTAAAYGDSTGMSYMQPAWVESASQNMDALILADFSLLPSFNGQPFQILGFLLNHPFVTLALALTVNYVVPRAFRAVVRFLVVPLVLGSIAWVVLQNPSTALDLLRGTFDCEHLAFPNLRYHDPAWCTDLSMCMICICMQRRMGRWNCLPPCSHGATVAAYPGEEVVGPHGPLTTSCWRAVATHHTIETSAVILIGLSFLLSPYLLVGGAVFLLLFGVPNVPAFMRPLVPAPLLEVCAPNLKAILLAGCKSIWSGIARRLCE